MLREILALGDKIDIKPLDQSGKPIHNARSFVSQLVDFIDTDVITIAAPIVYGKIIILNVGDNYNLCLYTKKGLYQCNCVVLKNQKENNTVVSVVRITTNLEKFQRRQYYRLECVHEIEYRLVTAEEELIERKISLDNFSNAEERNEYRKRLALIENGWIQGAITDLSGGGARFNSEQELSKGDKIKLKLDLLLGNNLKKMVLYGTIVSSQRMVNKYGVYEHRLEFKDILQKDREDLIKYIFEQDRKRRKNDKI